jgi:cyclophilin family peptidyl-prolyl cis-trans isomerase
MALRTAAAVVVAICVMVSASASGARAQAADPVLVFVTAKGSFEIQLFQTEAPKSVAQILALMKRNFYRAQRFHRVTASLAQFGDPQSRSMTQRASWGTGGSGTPIGVFEWSKKRTHVRGAVGLAHSGNPAYADSQLYIMKAASAGLDGKHAVIGRVTTGMTVVDAIAVDDMIKDARIK